MDESQKEEREEVSVEEENISEADQLDLVSDNMPEEEPLFPDDLEQEEALDQGDRDDNGTISNQFFNQVIREQEEFIDSLNQAENQLMLDEAFILMISSVCNKKTDDYYNYDHRDNAHLSMVDFGLT
jgi:hypothetical protein